MESKKYNLSGYWRRLGAIVFDQIITEIAAAVIILAFLAVLNFPDIMFNIYMGIFGYYGLVVALDFIHNVFLVKFTNGRSIGKAIFNERIVSLEESQLSILTLIIRWVIYNGLTLGLGWIGLLINFLTLRTKDLKQGLHDSAANTIVVKSNLALNKKLALVTGLFLIILFSCFISLVCAYSLMERIGNTFNEEMLQYQLSEELERA